MTVAHFWSHFKTVGTTNYLCRIIINIDTGEQLTARLKLWTKVRILCYNMHKNCNCGYRLI